MNLHREDFPFPYTPYPSQVEFMKCLYSALDTGKLAIMESPTGTVGILNINLTQFKFLLLGKIYEPDLWLAGMDARF